MSDPAARRALDLADAISDAANIHAENIEEVFAAITVVSSLLHKQLVADRGYEEAQATMRAGVRLAGYLLENLPE